MLVTSRRCHFQNFEPLEGTLPVEMLEKSRRCIFSKKSVVRWSSISSASMYDCGEKCGEPSCADDEVVTMEGGCKTCTEGY